MNECLRLSNNFRFPHNVLERVYDQQVILEHIFTRNFTAYGTIRVTNRAFDKQIVVRYTFDQWKTVWHLKGNYGRHYPENNTDVFYFKLFVPKEKCSWIRSVAFAIGYRVNDEEFWDNNHSENYTLQIETCESTDDQLARDYQVRNDPCPQVRNLCGLTNLGGTCYINSILQSLFLTSVLTDYFISEVQSKNGLLVNEYRNLLLLLCAGKYATVIPRPLQRILGEKQRVYLTGEQQDAHEFFLYLLDELHQDLFQNKSSIITDLFYGAYRSTITCFTCEHRSENFEPFISLTVPLPSTDQCTLEDCLAYLNTEEILSDDSQWFCPSCKCYRNAKKCLEIAKFPKILVIQFKRFRLNFHGESMKSDTLVIYPDDNLSCYSYSSSSPSIYTLYSVINHHGSLDDGHYTTFSRDLSSNASNWFQTDDEMISHLPNERLNSNHHAYLLFYTLKR